MKALIVQCTNTPVIWIRVGRHVPRPNLWHCQNDGFEVEAPTTGPELIAAVKAITQHSRQVGGTIQSVSEVDL